METSNKIKVNSMMMKMMIKNNMMKKMKKKNSMMKILIKKNNHNKDLKKEDHARRNDEFIQYVIIKYFK